MTKQEILDMPSIAYWSGLDGLEIKEIEYGTDDYLLCVSGAWNGKPKPHRLKIYTDHGGNSFVRLHGYKIPLSDCIRCGIF